MSHSLELELSPLHARPAAEVIVGLSGGLDSTVLLHRLATEAGLRHRLRAVHVHHGLHRDADAWQAHSAELCSTLGVRFTAMAVRVEANGEGLEAAARRARHAALEATAAPGDIVALAHHLDDQAETFLLRALRASGPEGLAAMRDWRAFGHAWLWRPLLAHPRAAIEAYARAHGLTGVHDPSNASAAHDRSWLRTHVMPLLRERWPHAAAAFATAAAHAREASALLDIEDRAALARCTHDAPDTLSITALRELPDARRARVVRLWIASLGLPPLPSRGVARIEADLLHARRDACARFAWHGASVRAWRDMLHAARDVPPLDPDTDRAWNGRGPLALPHGAQLALEPGVDLPAGACVRARRGGERIRLPGRAHHHALKHVLQDAGLPPWTREHLPLLVLGDEVLAAGDVALSGALTNLLDAHASCLVWTRPAGV